jgi:hypothetical protein
MLLLDYLNSILIVPYIISSMSSTFEFAIRVDSWARPDLS